MISVIIPTLNEADVLRRTIARTHDPHVLEVLIADGGSTDGTPDLARMLD